MAVSTPYLALLLATVAERLLELRLSRRHAELMLAQGGKEVGQRHYPWMVALHTLFLIGCVVEPCWRGGDFCPAYIPLVIGAQALRWWCIATLGERWNTRVVVFPGAPRVRQGPYRWLAHPNYVAVVVEGFSLPLVHSAFWVAGAFTVLNAALLTVRIRCENEALSRAEGEGDATW